MCPLQAESCQLEVGRECWLDIFYLADKYRIGEIFIGFASRCMSLRDGVICFYGFLDLRKAYLWSDFCDFFFW